MALNLESLLAPVARDDRTGPDLTYDPQRHEIEQAFDVSVSIDLAGMGEADSEIDWRRIIDIIVAQSAKTKDIWLAVYLCRAGARSGRLDIVETGVDYLAGLIEQYWHDGHPRLEDYGVEGRTGACDTLVNFREFIGPLRHAAVLSHPRHGSFTGEDLRRFQHGAETEADYGAFRATLEEESSIAALAAAVTRLDAIDASFRRVEALLVEQAGASAGASFSQVFEALADIRNAVRAFMPLPDESLGEDESGEGMDETSSSTGEARRTDTIRSREDVVRVIDMIVGYYRRSEPGSPVPMLLNRAREWVNRDFLDVLEDIAPGSIGDARALLLHRDERG